MYLLVTTIAGQPEPIIDTVEEGKSLLILDDLMTLELASVKDISKDERLSVKDLRSLVFGPVATHWPRVRLVGRRLPDSLGVDVAGVTLDRGANHFRYWRTLGPKATFSAVNQGRSAIVTIEIHDSPFG